MGKYESTVQINASTDTVWGVVSNGERLGDWLSPIRGVDSVEPSGPLAEGSKVTATIGNLGGASLKFKEAVAGQNAALDGRSVHGLHDDDADEG